MVFHKKKKVCFGLLFRNSDFSQFCQTIDKIKNSNTIRDIQSLMLHQFVMQIYCNPAKKCLKYIMKILANQCWGWGCTWISLGK